VSTVSGHGVICAHVVVANTSCLASDRESDIRTGTHLQAHRSRQSVAGDLLVADHEFPFPIRSQHRWTHLQPVRRVTEPALDREVYRTVAARSADPFAMVKTAVQLQPINAFVQGRVGRAKRTSTLPVTSPWSALLWAIGRERRQQVLGVLVEHANPIFNAESSCRTFAPITMKTGSALRTGPVNGCRWAFSTAEYTGCTTA
jgi:hypothetical protein